MSQTSTLIERLVKTSMPSYSTSEEATKALCCEAAEVVQILNSGQAEHVFETGDKLALSRSCAEFATFKPAIVWELTYLEHHHGTYGEDHVDPSECYYMTVNVEYFPGDKGLEALEAFKLRASNIWEPFKETGKGYTLEQFLTKKEG